MRKYGYLFFSERSERMKRIIAFLLAFIFAFCQIGIGLTEQPATPTDLDPVPPIIEIQTSDFAPSLSNMRQFSIIALNDFTQQGHVRGSVWVGGIMTGGPWMFVDDAAGASSYVYNNQSEVQFKGRTAEQGLDSYTALSDTAVTNAKNYWWTVYRNLGNNETTCIYVPASDDDVAQELASMFIYFPALVAHKIYKPVIAQYPDDYAVGAQSFYYALSNRLFFGLWGIDDNNNYSAETTAQYSDRSSSDNMLLKSSVVTDNSKWEELRRTLTDDKIEKMCKSVKVIVAK